MATLQELRGFFNDSDLREKVEAAIVISANNLITGVPSAEETLWTAGVFSSPASEAKKAVMAVLATNSESTIAQIQAASDAAIQANVDAVVPTLVAAYGV